MSKTALLIVDAQNEMFDPSNPVYQSEKLLGNLQSLIQKARSAKVPVIYVQHNDAGLVKGTDFWQIHSSLMPEEGDSVVQKWSANSFQRTKLLETLKNEGIQKLVIGGNQTEHCIAATTRSASGLGFDVVLAKDAHGTWDSDDLTAKQIINHQNELLSHFATLQGTNEITFEG